MSDPLAILVVIATPLLLITALIVSLRRNKVTIEEFDQPDLSELKICLPNHQVARAQRKLESLGWELAHTEKAVEDKTRTHALFRKGSDDEAAPIKDVLHQLNRSLFLPIGPFELNRQAEKPTR